MLYLTYKLNRKDQSRFFQDSDRDKLLQADIINTQPAINFICQFLVATDRKYLPVLEVYTKTGNLLQSRKCVPYASIIVYKKNHSMREGRVGVTGRNPYHVSHVRFWEFSWDILKNYLDKVWLVWYDEYNEKLNG